MKYVKLFENFKDDEIYKKFYSDIDYDVYNQILAIQSKKRIYKDWLLNLFRENKLKLEDLYKAEEYLSFFDRPNIKSKFGGEGYIKSIKDLSELHKLIEPFKSVELSPKEFKDKVYDETFVKEFKNFNLYIPKTYEQSCKLGRVRSGVRLLRKQEIITIITQMMVIYLYSYQKQILVRNINFIWNLNNIWMNTMKKSIPTDSWKIFQISKISLYH